MMFNKLAAATILASAVVTTSLAQNACCASVVSSDSLGITALLNSLGVMLHGVNVPIGLDCSPITGVWVSGTLCTNDPVNCDEIIASAVVGINCTPIDMSG